jgi:hypothetical protein
MSRAGPIFQPGIVWDPTAAPAWLLDELLPNLEI